MGSQIYMSSKRILYCDLSSDVHASTEITSKKTIENAKKPRMAVDKNPVRPCSRPWYAYQIAGEAGSISSTAYTEMRKKLRFIDRITEDIS